MDSKLTKDERRTAILRAALPLFAEKGLQATTKELAASAGVSEALLYKHFSTKEELFDSLKNFCCEAADRDAAELILKEPSLELLVEGLFFTNIAILFDHPEAPFATKEISALVARSLLDKGDFAKEMYGHFGKYIPYLRDSLEAAITDGHAERLAIHQNSLFWLYHNMIVGVAFTDMPTQEVAPYGRDKHQLAIELVVHGLRMCGVKEEVIKNQVTNYLNELKKKYFKGGEE